MTRRPTIVDVAQVARVSKSTVARAISNSSAVDPYTRKRVWEAIRHLGYEPNFAAASMRSGKRHLLGMIVPDNSDAFWAEVVRAAQDRAEHHGFGLTVLSSDWIPTRQVACTKALLRVGVDAILVNNVIPSARELDRLDVPMVAVGSLGAEEGTLPSVHSDTKHSVEVAIKRLVDTGHRELALIGSSLRLACPFLEAARTVWRQMGMESTGLSEVLGDYSLTSGRTAFRHLTDRLRFAPTAILAANDLMAIGAIMEARQQGIDCPGDVSIMGMDGVLTGQVMTPPLSTISKPKVAIGATAVDLAVEQVEGVSVFRDIALRGVFAQGGTVAAR